MSDEFSDLDILGVLMEDSIELYPDEAIDNPLHQYLEWIHPDVNHPDEMLREWLLNGILFTPDKFHNLLEPAQRKSLDYPRHIIIDELAKDFGESIPKIGNEKSRVDHLYIHLQQDAIDFSFLNKIKQSIPYSYEKCFIYADLNETSDDVISLCIENQNILPYIQLCEYDLDNQQDNKTVIEFISECFSLDIPFSLGLVGPDQYEDYLKLLVVSGISFTEDLSRKEFQNLFHDIDISIIQSDRDTFQWKDLNAGIHEILAMRSLFISGMISDPDKFIRIFRKWEGSMSSED